MSPKPADNTKVAAPRVRAIPTARRESGVSSPTELGLPALTLPPSHGPRCDVLQAHTLDDYASFPKSGIRFLDKNDVKTKGFKQDFVGEPTKSCLACATP